MVTSRRPRRLAFEPIDAFQVGVEAVADPAAAFHQLAAELDLQVPGEPPVDTTRVDAWRTQLTRAEIADIRTSSEPEAARWDYSDAAAW